MKKMFNEIKYVNFNEDCDKVYVVTSEPKYFHMLKGTQPETKKAFPQIRTIATKETENSLLYIVNKGTALDVIAGLMIAEEVLNELDEKEGNVEVIKIRCKDQHDLDMKMAQIKEWFV